MFLDTSENGVDLNTTQEEQVKTMELGGLKSTEISPLPSPTNATSNKPRRNSAWRRRRLRKQNSLYEDISSCSDEETYTIKTERKPKRRRSNEKPKTDKTAKETEEAQNSTSKHIADNIATGTHPVKTETQFPTINAQPKAPKIATQSEPENIILGTDRIKITAETIETQSAKTANEPQPTKPFGKTTFTTPNDINKLGMREFLGQLVFKKDQKPQLFKENKLVQSKMQKIRNSCKCTFFPHKSWSLVFFVFFFFLCVKTYYYY